MNGVRYFDMRVKLNDSQQISWKHGAFELGKLNDDVAFHNTLQRAVNDKELIVIAMDFTISNSPAWNAWGKWLNYSGFYKNNENITNIDKLSSTVKSYKDRGIYILTIPLDLVLSNYDGSLQCFTDASLLCKNSCVSNGPQWNTLDTYINKHSQLSSTNQINVTQAFWQSPKGDTLSNFYTCSVTDGNLLEINRKSRINQHVLEHFEKNRNLLPNVVMINNVDHNTPKLVNLLHTNALQKM